MDGNLRLEKDLSDWLVNESRVDSAKWDAVSQAFFNLGGRFHAALISKEEADALDAFPVVHLAVGDYPKDAIINLAAEETMRVWYRSGTLDGSRCKVANDMALRDGSNDSTGKLPGRISAPSTQEMPRKRALDSVVSNAVGKKAKPTIRASKGQDLGDLLSGFGN